MKLLLLTTTVLFATAIHAQKITELQNSSFKLHSVAGRDIGRGNNAVCFYKQIPFGVKQLVCAISTKTGSTPQAISLTGQMFDYYHHTPQPVFTDLIRGITGAVGESSINFIVYDNANCGNLLIYNYQQQCYPVDITNQITSGIFYFDQQTLRNMQGKKCAFCIQNNDAVRAVYATVELTQIE